MNFSKKEILTISIHITKVDKIEGNTGEVIMIYFTGHVDGELFKGSIKQEGIDTQLHYFSKIKTLSARYLLEGTDYEGKPCHLFIENNATIQLDSKSDENIKTHPKIITDSKVLAWLETADLCGEIEATKDELLIHIYLINEVISEA